MEFLEASTMRQEGGLRMAGFSPKVPLTLDPDDGYTLNTTLKEVARQNFKNLVLTSPGERIMDPEFGVGIRSYLFENNGPATYGQIEARIREQTQKYLPYIQIDQIQFNTQDINSNISDNFLGVRISYIIKKLAISDALEIPIN
jgi:phage baseplate assembly protein W